MIAWGTDHGDALTAANAILDAEAKGRVGVPRKRRPLRAAPMTLRVYTGRIGYRGTTPSRSPGAS